MLLRKICVAIVLLALFASCSKIIEREPTHALDGNENFKKIGDYELALIGAYSLFRQGDYYGNAASGFSVLPDMLSDNFNENLDETLGNYSILATWTYAEDETNIGAIWLAAYKVIMQANLVLRNLDQFASTEPQTVNRLKGQALAIRAFAHFDVLRYWVTDFARNSDKPGIPYIDKFDYEVKPGRGTVKTSYDKIEADLLQALTLLNDTDKEINTPGANRAFIDADVVHAMLARIYLYANELDKAIDESTLLIDNYPLSDSANFVNIWRDIPNQEVIWSVAFNSGEGRTGDNIYFVPNDRSSFNPNPTLIDTYDTTTDVRYLAYFSVISDRLVLSKYLAKASAVGNPDGVVNFKVFRSGEMYLIRAEANARKGGAGEGLALDDLNVLRITRRPQLTPGTETGQDLIDAIALERRKELVGEGHRWFDVKRTTREFNRDDCTDFCTLQPNNRSWAWPIPQDEILANPAIKPQNDGY